MPVLRHVLLTVLMVVAVLACGCGDSRTATGGTAASIERTAALRRATAIEREVAVWARATTLDLAQASAARVRALIGGPAFAAAGGSPPRVGLLPGADGTPGLASAVPEGCVRRDVLGGSWDDPQQRWSDLMAVIDAWTPTNNTFPSLPSHAQRTFGWATLTTRASTLEQTREYAGHAGGHAAVVTSALRDPGAAPCPGG